MEDSIIRTSLKSRIRKNLTSRTKDCVEGACQIENKHVDIFQTVKHERQQNGKRFSNLAVELLRGIIGVTCLLAVQLRTGRIAESMKSNWPRLRTEKVVPSRAALKRAAAAKGLFWQLRRVGVDSHSARYHRLEWLVVLSETYAGGQREPDPERSSWFSLST